MSDSPPAELFEPTPRTAMAELLDSQRRGEVVEFLMKSYYAPLAAYLAATSFRTLGEPRDLIAGFFASRLAREEWLDAWRASNLRLRRWLVNGLLFYCREEARRRRRDASAEPPEETIPASIDRDFERNYAQYTVRQSFEAARLMCEAEGFLPHWQLFVRHHMDGRNYQQLAKESGLTVGQVNGMVRTAGLRFRKAISERLLRDGADPADLDREIGLLLKSLGTG
jgi:DNA-directed RNA polymerase specialized sigma24 family protein